MRRNVVQKRVLNAYSSVKLDIELSFFPSAKLNFPTTIFLSENLLFMETTHVIFPPKLRFKTLRFFMSSKCAADSHTSGKKMGKLQHGNGGRNSTTQHKPLKIAKAEKEWSLLLVLRALLWNYYYQRFVMA